MPKKTIKSDPEQKSPNPSKSAQTVVGARISFDGRRFFPAGLNLKGRRVLVIGDRDEILPHIQNMIEFGASVDVVAHVVLAELRELAVAYSHKLSILKLAVKDVLSGSLDLKQYFMVFAFSTLLEDNEKIVELAGRAGVLSTELGLKTHSDFAVPTWFRRGHIKISVSTDGISGALERALINRIKAAFIRDMDHYALFADFVLERLRAAGGSIGGDDEQGLNFLAEKMFQSEDVCLALQRNNFDEATLLFEQELEEVLDELKKNKEEGR